MENKRFENKQMIKKTQQARELVSHSVEELYGISEPTMDAYNEAMAMSEATPEEIKLKSKKLKMASKELDRYHKKAFKYIEAKKLIKQYEYYSNWNSIFNTQLDKNVNV